MIHLPNLFYPAFTVVMPRNIFVQQFTCRNFGFGCTEETKKLFYVSQWSERRTLFFLYRLFMASYHFGWTLAYYISRAIYNPAASAISYRFLTIWGNMIITVYLLLALALSLIGVIKRKDLFYDTGGVKILRTSVWFFHVISAHSAILITIVYWGFLAPNSTGNLAEALNIQLHVMNSVVILIDMFIMAIPQRLLHVVYFMLFGFTYVIMTLILHGTGVTSAVYSILDWAKSPGLAAGLSLGLMILGGSLCSLLFFGIYVLKLKCSPSPLSPEVRPHSEINYVEKNAINNPAFELDEAKMKENIQVPP